MKNITETCKSCGNEHLPESRPTGQVIRGSSREAALVTALHSAEERESRATCRVRELEMAIRAVLLGRVKTDVLREVVEAPVV